MSSSAEYFLNVLYREAVVNSVTGCLVGDVSIYRL